MTKPASAAAPLAEPPPSFFSDSATLAGKLTEAYLSIRNETEETVRVLMFSTVVVPTATVYPDSDKVGIWTGDPETDVMVRRESKVEYFDGEG